MTSLFTTRNIPEAFAVETRRLLLSRLRVAIVLAVVLHLSFVPVDFSRLPERFWPATSLRLVSCAVLVGLLPLLGRRAAERWAVTGAGLVATFTSLPILGLVLFAQGPSDPLYLTQMIAIVFVVMGVGLFFPIDGRTALAVAGIPVLMHVVLTARFPLLANLPVIAASLMALLVAVAGAELNFATRLTEYESRLVREQLVAARSRFVAMLSHDIKNPLATIMGFAEIIRENLPAGSDLVQSVDAIESGAQAAMGLALNFLDADRIETGSIKVRRTEASLNEIVERAIQHEAARARPRRVELRLELSADLPALMLDEPLIDRVVANLLSNAIKFSPSDGIVRIITGCRDGRAQLAIRDEGPGIAGEDRSALFERYGRSPSGRTDSTGLGLYIVKTFVEAHAGSVRVDCPRDGGTVFEVSFPTV